MSKKVNTAAIGLFIVAGLALGVTGLLLLRVKQTRIHEIEAGRTDMNSTWSRPRNESWKPQS
jgi:hypothetical protein